MQTLSVRIFNSPEEAPNYNTNGEGIKAAFVKEAVIVKNGTVGKNATVDLVFQDEKGQKYVAMLTGRLLKTVTDVL